MNSQENSNKLKIFVRYLPGSSGHFISLLLVSLIDDVKMQEPHRGHNNVDDINYGHNWNTQWTEDYKKYTNINVDLEQGINWVKSNFGFCPIEREFYVIHTHAINPDPLMMAFDNTKLINIDFDDHHKTQMSYNWITKSVVIQNQYSLVKRQLMRIQENTKKLIDLDPDSLNEKKDLKLLTYINQLGLTDMRQQFKTYECHESYKDNVFTIQFSDILNKQISEQLDSIIKFLGITVTQEKKGAAIKMINNYANAQTVAPWQLELDSY